jgi:hypothetical protein
MTHTGNAGESELSAVYWCDVINYHTTSAPLTTVLCIPVLVVETRFYMLLCKNRLK